MRAATLSRTVEEVELFEAESTIAPRDALLSLITDFHEGAKPEMPHVLAAAQSEKVVAAQPTSANLTKTRPGGGQAEPPTSCMPQDDTAHADPDAPLVARAKFGDLKAFEDLIARHSRRVYRAVVSIVGNVEESQDATQDTFLKAFQHIGDFQYRSKFSTWLLSIASNTALQRLRENRRLEWLDENCGETETFPRQVRACEADPEELYLEAERRQLVKTGLKKVPSKYRAVLLLRDIEQLSAEEAARELGLGIPAIKARLFRARLMLREILSRHFAMDIPSSCD